MSLRQQSIRHLLLAFVLFGLASRLSAQEADRDLQVDSLVAKILKTDASNVPGELLSNEAGSVRSKVAGELLRRRQRLGDAVLTLLAIREEEFPAKKRLDEETRTMLRSLGPATRRSIAPVLADWLLSDAAPRRRIAAQALRNLDGLPQNAVPNLLKAARSHDARARADACQALAWVEPVPADIEPVIRKCMNEVDPGSRHPAAAGLLVIKHDDQQAMRILIDTLVNSRTNPALVSEVRIALKQAGPELLQFSGRWRKEEALWNEVRVLLRRREKEALPILMEWLRNRQTPEDLRLGILRALGSLSSVPPEVRDTLIAVATEPNHDGYFLYFALLPLRKANGFDANKLSSIAIEKLDTVYIAEFMETLCACSDDRAQQAEALRHYMNHPSTKVSAAARMRMAVRGCNDPEVLQYVRTRLSIPRPSIRAQGASLAGCIARKSGLFMDELFATLEDRGTWKSPTNLKYYVNDSAVAGLAALGDRALPGLLKRLEHRDAAVRGLAARTLGRMKAHNAVGPLTRILVDSKPDLNYWGNFASPQQVRLESLRALANIGEPHIKHLLPEFEKLLEHDWSRLDAIRAVGSVGASGSRLTPRLLKISATNRDPKSDEELARAIARINPGRPAAFEGIQLVLKRTTEKMPHVNWRDQRAFCNTMELIQSLGPEAKPLIPALRDLVEKEELLYFGIRAYAAATLAVIDKENPRWQSMVERWKSGRWLNDGRVYHYSHESTVWDCLRQLEN